LVAIPFACRAGRSADRDDAEVLPIQNSGEGNCSFCDTDLYGTYECYSDLIRAAHVVGQTPSQKGDSAGPVFTLSGTYNVIARAR
jgi:streptogrisin D